MQRRQYLKTGSAVTLGATVAGCLGGLFDSGPENVVLSEPEDQGAESSSLAYPAYGEPLPDFSLPDPFTDEPFRPEEMDEPFLCTSFYAFCPAECVLLLGSFANVQAALDAEGLRDEIGLVAITFDPERDTPEALSEHAEMIGIDYEHEMWRYLRPADDAEAKEIVEERLGLGFEKVGGGDAYDFNHLTITFLVNPDTVVERAYRGDRLDVDRVVSDLTTVHESYQ